MKLYRLIPASFLALLIFASIATAQSTRTISYQGILQSNGSPANGSYTLALSFYTSSSGGTSLYTEDESVLVTNGLFNISIGSQKSLEPTLDFTKPYWLGVSVNGDSELTPRTLVSFAPYAFHALTTDTASYATKAATANGLGVGVLQAGSGISLSSFGSQYTITSTGVLSVNGKSGNVTLAGTGGTTVTQNGSQITINSATFTGGTGIQAIQSSDSSITVVNGSGPIATITIAKQNASTGQALIWNGSQWKPATPFSGIQNTDTTLSLTNPNGPTTTVNLASQNATSGQVLQFNGKFWRPATVSGVGPDSIKNLGDARVYPTLGSLFLGAGSGTKLSLPFDSAEGNTGVGFNALASDTTGSENTAMGNDALFTNASGKGNVAIGELASQFSIGSDNTVVGLLALNCEKFASVPNKGSFNCAFGQEALSSNDTGSYNTAMGNGALEGYFFMGSYNTAVGYQAVHNQGNVSHIVGIGDSALFFDGAGSIANDSGSENTAVGSSSQRWSKSGAYNTSTGYQSLHQLGSGYHNTANGASALWATLGSGNTGMGSQSMIGNTTGNANTAIGYQTLTANVTGSQNTAVGDSAGTNSIALNNTTTIGYGAQATVNNEVVLGNANVASLYCQGAYASTTANAANLYVASNGQIMRSTSSARYKTNIRDLDFDADKLYDLRPVSYTSKIDGKEYFGLVAEDVAKVLPELAEYARAKDVIPGSQSDQLIPDAVKYPMLSVILLQELKKEHSKEEAQQKTIDDLLKRVQALEEKIESK